MNNQNDTTTILDNSDAWFDLCDAKILELKTARLELEEEESSVVVITPDDLDDETYEQVFERFAARKFPKPKGVNTRKQRRIEAGRKFASIAYS